VSLNTGGYDGRDMRHACQEGKMPTKFWSGKAVEGCNRLNGISNHDLKPELGIYKLIEKIQTNETNWLQRVERMEY
jgi:hypothetical protein